jgi:hypothetical protein
MTIDEGKQIMQGMMFALGRGYLDQRVVLDQLEQLLGRVIVESQSANASASPKAIRRVDSNSSLYREVQREGAKRDYKPTLADAMRKLIERSYENDQEGACS